MNLQDRTEEEFETCICGCGQMTDVRKDTPIDQRNHYVEGAGQFLPAHFAELYGSSLNLRVNNMLWLKAMGITAGQSDYPIDGDRER